MGYVCMYVCLYVCMYMLHLSTCVCARARACVHNSFHAFVHNSFHAFTSCARECVCVCENTIAVMAYCLVRFLACTVSIHVCVYVNVRTCMHSIAALIKTISMA